jgi:hypothetical protein
VIISWVAPFDNHLPIDSYRVLIKDAAAQYTEYTDLCDGSDVAAMTE